MAKPAIPLFDSVDPGKPFIPAELTPLFHTPCYGDLTDGQRLRYNQLHALHFVRIPAFWTGVMRWAVSHPVSLPLFLWLMLLQEERSLYYSRAYLRSATPLEPAFVETHRRHMADEAHHVRWDEELLDALW